MSPPPSSVQSSRYRHQDRLDDEIGHCIAFVDLDGTLIATDLFGECLIRGCAESASSLVKLIRSSRGGIAALKQSTADYVETDVTVLPYRREVLNLLHRLRADGWTLVLATATDEHWARQVADHLQLFDDVLASDGIVNLKGCNKLKAIRDYCTQRNINDFAYIGDSTADLSIWNEAAEAFVVNRHRSVVRKLSRNHEHVHVIDIQSSPGKAAWRLMRPWQWLKNTLVMVPVFLGHRILDVTAVAHALTAMLCMCLCASAVYIVNDLLDLQADRLHPRKKQRPLAAGAISLKSAIGMAVLLTACGFALGLATLPVAFSGVLLGYMSLSMLYSVWLKRKPITDVIVLAGLYTLRIYAGGIAADIAVSDWLLTLSIFLFTSLAFAKRHAELMRLESEGQKAASGRGYIVEDLALIRTLGPTSGYLAVLVLALYSQSEVTQLMYPESRALWLVCPLALFWISRLWLIAGRGHLDEDPVVFALRDRVSLATGVGVVILLIIAATKGTIT